MPRINKIKRKRGGKKEAAASGITHQPGRRLRPSSSRPSSSRPSSSPAARPPARSPGRRRYLRPLPAVPARRCAPAAVQRVRRSGAARLTAPSGRKRAPFSQTKHPTALSPALPVPAPGPWLCSSAATFPPGKVARARALEPVWLSRAFGAFALGSQRRGGGNARERGLAGAWETAISLLFSVSSQKSSARQRPAALTAGEQSTAGAISRRNEQGNMLSCALDS
ncbi:uncharacterized protein LOC142086181 isoform X2 [Calonectris borealis]|uniref:uncharacterized protein LOC142086181 isoform X2 n=1 Tax=Calonectris borealis TaxID=1323832 RepID=UPI003F4B8C31